MLDVAVNHAEPIEARWRVWGRSASAVAIVLVLVALGVANIAMYSRWHEVEDGVLWDARAEGVTAADVLPGSAGAAAGIEPGDVLVAVNGIAVDSPADWGSTSTAVTPSARTSHSTPSSTSCHREYIATLATPSVTSTSTMATAEADRPHTRQRASTGSA